MRRLSVIVLGTLATVSGVTFALSTIGTARSDAPFTSAVTPARQSVTRGETASFSLGVVRSKSFSGAIRLRVAGLPPGVRRRWRLADGTLATTLPRAANGAVLTLRPSARTPLGRRRVRVIARGGGTRLTRRLSLTVEPRRSHRFSLKARPPRRTVPQGAETTYRLRVLRSARFRGPVQLRVSNPPRGTSARLASRKLTISTTTDQPLGTHQLLISGTGRIRGRTSRRYAVVVLTVAQAQRFRISGDLTAPLHPGGGAPLDLHLINPQRFQIRVTSLEVALNDDTTDPGCTGDVNYIVSQYTGGYPLVVPPGRTALSELVPDVATWPQVSMRDLPINQDACRGAALSLLYDGQASR